MAAGMNMALQAQDSEYRPQVTSTTHVEKTLPGDDSKTVIIREFTFPDGYVGSQHYHTGSVFVYVLEGELTIDVEGMDRAVVSAGQLYQEPLGRNMTARNVSASDARVLVFQVGETGKPMMIEVK
jgi:quercetin dioxygenase-like cupin family protein